MTATLALSQKATAVSVGPNGLVYVSLPNEILEVDPRTLKPTLNGAISVTGTPGPLVFTSDGQYGIGANQALFGNSLLIATLATHTVHRSEPGITPNHFTAGDRRGHLARALHPRPLSDYDFESRQCYPDIDTRISSTGLLAITSHQRCSQRALTAPFKPRIWSQPPTCINTIPRLRAVVAAISHCPECHARRLSYAVPAETTAQSHPATLLTYGTNQTILPSAISEPLVVQVLDANNLPLSGYTVQFQTNGGTLDLSTSAVTGSNGVRPDLSHRARHSGSRHRHGDRWFAQRRLSPLA